MDPSIVHRTPVWLDCDPGHDDAFAILLAAKHPSVKLLGISTIHGNASVKNCTANALSLLTAMGETAVPVYEGSQKPFMRPAVHAPDIHGTSGIDGTNLLPAPTCSVQSTPAIIAMREAILSTEPQTCCLVVTGTMTNAALLFAAFPELAVHIKSLSIMGGSFQAGNITKWAEFNIFCDPESASSLFTLPALSHKIYLCPLDLTHTVLATSTILSTLMTSTPTPFRTMLHDLLTYFAETYARVFGIGAGPPLHDPLAVAAILPDSTTHLGFEWKETTVDVVVFGQKLGMTVMGQADVERHILEEGLAHGLDHVTKTTTTHSGKNGEEAGVMKTVVKVGVKCNVDAFWNTLMAAVEKADATSPLNC